MSIDLDVLIGLNILSVVVLAIIMSACLLEKKSSPSYSGYFIAMLAIEILYLIFNAFQYSTERAIKNSGVLSLAGRYIAFRGMSNVMIFLLLIVFTFYAAAHISDNSKFGRWGRNSVILVCSAYAFGCLLTVFIPSFADKFFYVDSTGGHSRGTFVFALFGAYYLVVVLLITIIKSRKKLNKYSLFAILSFLVCPILVSFQRFFGKESYIMGPAMFVSLIAMYCFLYLQNSERLHRQDLVLANSRLDVLKNQIRPHFLYNTLNSIYVLCGKDPTAAQEAISDFAEYMRANLENLEEDDVIPLESELEHVDHYLSLEKMRFGGDLEVEYDTDYTDMLIPPMTLQILAENAVKHGIEQKRNGFGKITIRTRRSTNTDLVIVEDNGVGFDVEEYNDDPGSHVGIVNVKERLKQLLGASLIIESETGRGTTVTIIIPRDGKRVQKNTETAEVED